MRNYFVLTLILFGQYSFGQNNRIDSLLRELKNDIEIEQREYSGRVVWDDETKETYYSLMDICPNKTLLKFTDDSNAVIRIYMYLGFVRNSNNKILQRRILKKHRNDTIEITEKQGCVVHSWKVIEHMQMTFNTKQEKELKKLNYKKEIELIRNKPHIVINGARHGKIKKEMLQELDSLTFSKNGINVSSFEIYLETDTAYSSTSSSNKLTETMKSEIMKLKTGDKIYFDEIKIKDPDNITRTAGSIALRIQ